jgi:hypothetical protein
MCRLSRNCGSLNLLETSGPGNNLAQDELRNLLVESYSTVNRCKKHLSFIECTVHVADDIGQTEMHTAELLVAKCGIPVVLLQYIVKETIWPVNAQLYCRDYKRKLHV